jgi:hypothetical protein
MGMAEMAEKVIISKSAAACWDVVMHGSDKLMRYVMALSRAPVSPHTTTTSFLPMTLASGYSYQLISFTVPVRSLTSNSEVAGRSLKPRAPGVSTIGREGLPIIKLQIHPEYSPRPVLLDESYVAAAPADYCTITLQPRSI